MNNNMTQYLVELDEAMQHDLEELQDTRPNKSLEEILMQVIKSGLYNLNYRTQRNRKVYQKNKMSSLTIEEQQQRLKSLEELLNKALADKQ